MSGRRPSSFHDLHRRAMVGPWVGLRYRLQHQVFNAAGRRMIWWPELHRTTGPQQWTPTRSRNWRFL
ncbi:hypothetical protein PVAP13_5KG450107 [Panicum virgatum]|uniref:Uncharacterized protein n=1 Tax=Panicum virgatum TaxID=38727 RepID=A0A8T0SQ65_PANVG|nr:hypothetical protein PVAP13_5KG450107 [Panicum virgatum]